MRQNAIWKFTKIDGTRYIDEALYRNPRRLMEDIGVTTAIIYRTATPIWSRDYEEYQLQIAPGLWMAAPKGWYTPEEQREWRQDNYAHPKVRATWASHRTPAEKAQLKRCDLDEFKALHGAYSRPSKNAVLKPAADQNEIQKLLDEKPIDEVAKLTGFTRGQLYKMAMVR